jgi:hypothetical protein
MFSPLVGVVLTSLLFTSTCISVAAIARGGLASLRQAKLFKYKMHTTTNREMLKEEKKKS